MPSNPFEEILTELTEIKTALSLLSSTPAPQIEIIDRRELQRRLAITEPTVIRWGKRGTIPEIRIGTNIRYNWPAVVEALEKTGQKGKKTIPLNTKIMQQHESFIRLINFLDERWPGATIKHDWNNCLDPDLTDLQMNIRDYKGRLFEGLSHFTIERDGIILAEAKIFINYKS